MVKPFVELILNVLFYIEAKYDKTLTKLITVILRYS